MDFRHPDGRKAPVFLPRRSLLIMKGESRYLWTHGLAPSVLYLSLDWQCVDIFDGTFFHQYTSIMIIMVCA